MEKSVDIVETWVIEVLSDRVFYSLDALNQAVAIQVDMINDRRGFRGIDQSRRELFEQTDKPRLRTDHVPRWSSVNMAKIEGGGQLPHPGQQAFLFCPLAFGRPTGRRADF